MVKHIRHSKNFIVKNVLLVLLFIFNTASVISEEYSLALSERIEFKKIPIELVSIGSAGSVSMKVGNVNVPLQVGKEKSISDINITVVEITEELVKISVTQNVVCLLNEDCKDNIPCTEGICTDHKDCIFKKSEGCIKEGGCLPTGSISDIESESYYCSLSSEWQKRKAFNNACIDNYECLSGVCNQGLCTKHELETRDEKMAPIWILIVFGIILLIKGAFLLYYPEKAKNILRELSYKKIFSLRMIGTILALLGMVLIVWALT